MVYTIDVKVSKQKFEVAAYNFGCGCHEIRKNLRSYIGNIDHMLSALSACKKNVIIDALSDS
jgi:hypothetical protein